MIFEFNKKKFAECTIILQRRYKKINGCFPAAN